MKEIEQDSKVIYKGKILNLRIDRVFVEKNGRYSTREIIEHKPSVAILPITEDGNIVFIRQYRYAIKDYLLEIPAGVINEGEDLEEAARRELREETGFLVDKLKYIGYFYPSCGYLTEIIHIYIAYVKGKDKTDMDDDEDIETVLVSREEALMMLGNAYIKDMKAAVALQHFFLLNGG